MKIWKKKIGKFGKTLENLKKIWKFERKIEIWKFGKKFEIWQFFLEIWEKN